MNPLTRRELVKRLREFGFDVPHSGGKHSFMRKRSLKVRIPNPHKNDVIDIDLLDRIRKQAGVPKKEWEKYD